MNLLVGTSLIAAYVAGVAALFAPCCITVLLPSYFGSIFRTRKAVFIMTFIFFLGVLAVFLPLGLGFSALGQIFSRYHSLIFTVAGVFFIGLGLSLVLGKKITLPYSVNPKLGSHHSGSVFMLGVVSGIATTCCAPVLAGALALSILPGSIAWGMLYTLAYVLGMVSPLFVLALALDRSKLTQKFLSGARRFSYSIMGIKAEIGLSELISGITFFVMGVLTLAWAAVGNVAKHSDLQVDINIALTRVQQALTETLGGVPEFAWGILLVLVVCGAAYVAKKQYSEILDKQSNNE